MNTQKTYYDRKMSQKNKITELVPFQRRVNVLFKVLKKGYIRRIRKNGKSVSECLIADDTGSILLTVWDEDIEMLETGEYFALYGGYVNIHNNKLKLNKSRYGEIEPCPDQGFELNIENNLSKKDYDRTMTLLQSKMISPEAINRNFNIGQDNVKIIGMDI